MYNRWTKSFVHPTFDAVAEPDLIYLAKITHWEVTRAHSGGEAPSQSSTPGWYKIAARCNQAGEKKNASHRHHGTSSPHLPDPQQVSTIEDMASTTNSNGIIAKAIDVTKSFCVRR